MGRPDGSELAADWSGSLWAVVPHSVPQTCLTHTLCWFGLPGLGLGWVGCRLVGWEGWLGLLPGLPNLPACGMTTIAAPVAARAWSSAWLTGLCDSNYRIRKLMLPLWARGGAVAEPKAPASQPNAPSSRYRDRPGQNQPGSCMPRLGWPAHNLCTYWQSMLIIAVTTKGTRRAARH